ncbi:hypothetical protein [Tranquillimonas alkanivorans]|uniref:Uncharacterized protein n=1 Tax=Tranquillimonas alkanivorans TaxID=441119 RepID=A0A1I5N3Z2_9RHOB|nr:hypothetical protein [Tranquillimonas alkanivorans]SFP16538.1 hypothetical protein SAMN04488047_10386 [Tranquillimonas alkanivorans]
MAQVARPNFRSLVSPFSLIALFSVGHVVTAIALQSVSHVAPWVDGSPLNVMNGTLLSISAALALLMALLTTAAPTRAVPWLVAGLVFAAVAVEEVFPLEALAEQLRGDGAKVGLAVLTAFAISLTVRSPFVPGRAVALLGLGYGAQLNFLLVELGDGTLFTLPGFSLQELRLLEEYLEFGAASLYFAGISDVVLTEIGASGPDPAHRVEDA